MVTEKKPPRRPLSMSDFLSSGRMAWVALLLVWVMLAVLTAAALWVMRVSTLRDQQRALHTLAVVVSDELERGLDGVDEGLTAIANAIEEDGMPDDAAEASARLRRRVELMPMAQTLWLLDPQGRGVTRSDAIGFPPVDGFAPPLKANAVESLSFSRPFADPSAARPLVAIALPMETARYGWVVAGVPVDVLLGAFQSALPEDEAEMRVSRSDGTLLASTDGSPLSRHVHLAEHVLIEGYGLQVDLFRSRDVVLHDWRASAQMAAVLLVLLAAVMAAALWILQRAQRRHEQAQQALRLQQARGERLEALGRMAGEVAHDFNNVLGAIAGYGEMALDKAEPGSAQARQLDRLIGATARGRALTERILAFSRGGARRSVVFVLQTVVEEVLEHVRSLKQPGIRLDVQLAAPEGRVRGDPAQAYQAVLNLCVNALQAMPEGGVLQVSLGQERVDAEQVLSHSRLSAGEWLRLVVADEGRGIDPVSMEHLLEPFYTTRAGEGGTGLGLAVVHGAVVELHGAIDVQSQPGEGARFALWLPVCAPVQEQHRAQPWKPGQERGQEQGQDSPSSQEFGQGRLPPAAGDSLHSALPSLEPESGPDRDQGKTWGRVPARVLVLDDEPELAALTATTLKSLGLDTTAETRPLRAFDMLQTQPSHFAALITDERMPELTGTELVLRLREAGGALEQLPVILLTGQGGPMLAARAAELGIRHILRKPLERQELADALSSLLQKP